LNAFPNGSIATWDHLKKAFLTRLFTTTKYMAKRREVSGFQKEDGENLYDAWEWYILLLKECPRHKFCEMEVTFIFINGLKPKLECLYICFCRWFIEKQNNHRDSRAYCQNVLERV